MIDPEYVDKMLSSEWVEEITPGKMGEKYVDETYQLKEGAPEDMRQEWEAFVALSREAG